MSEPLLARQARLLDYLTSEAALFGSDAPPLDPVLRGIDARLLRLEARFSHEKRMDKIRAVFPRTFALLGERRVGILRDFAATVPPTDISRYANARQFHEFLTALWRTRVAQPRYLPDVAACEFAGAQARFNAEAARQAATDNDGRSPGIRRHPAVVLLRCRHDVRALFEGGPVAPAPKRRDLCLAVACAHEGHPEICELRPAVFELLDALEAWTDPAVLGAGFLVEQIRDDLVRHGLLEVRP